MSVGQGCFCLACHAHAAASSRVAGVAAVTQALHDIVEARGVKGLYQGLVSTTRKHLALCATLDHELTRIITFSQASDSLSNTLSK